MKNKKVRKVLALALAIGITGSLGSLAYFYDKENLNGDLKITIGTLSSDTTKTIKIENMDIETPVSDTFIIVNSGTLDQILKMSLKNPSIGNDGLEKIKYSLTFESSNGRKIKGYGNGEETLSSLFNKDIKLIGIDNEELVLNEGETITAILTLNMQRDMPDKYSDTEFKFDLNISYTQENNN